MEGSSASSVHEKVGQEFAAIWQGLVGGALYGVRMRLPHALVMTTVLVLLKLLSLQIRRLEIKNGEEGAFHWLGRTLLTLLVDGSRSGGRRLVARPPGVAQNGHHALIAGALGGYCIWGRYSSVNYQIVLYLTSRVAVGGIRLASQRGVKPFSNISFRQCYPILSATVWGLVMMLFEEHPEVLQPSLKSSMESIYRYDSTTPIAPSVLDRIPSGIKSKPSMPRSMTSGLSNIDFIDES
eukprot:scaffold6819_cov51-Attheya_sp.AAC.6